MYPSFTAPQILLPEPGSGPGSDCLLAPSRASDCQTAAWPAHIGPCTVAPVAQLCLAAMLCTVHFGIRRADKSFSQERGHRSGPAWAMLQRKSSPEHLEKKMKISAQHERPVQFRPGLQQTHIL